MAYFINIRNKTHYVSPTTKQSFRLLNPDTYEAKSLKQLSYYVRAYYHYKYITAIGGQVYFYTLTYNNKALPHLNGIPCFDHKKLRYFLRESGFDKRLYRKYGLKMQYLVTCELGDGKGKRGFANNPHYHVLFFLSPLNNSKKYRSLSPSTFQHIVRCYWCGDNYRNIKPRQYKFGIAMPGKNYGLVNGAGALNYVCKYVTKDVNHYGLHKQLKDSFITQIEDFIKNDLRCRAKYEKYFYIKCLSSEPFKTSNVDDFNRYLQYVVNWSYNHFCKRKVFNALPRVFVSQGVGLFALDNVNSDGLTISLPQNTKQMLTTCLPLYLYRKLYYDVVKDAKGNNKYILNQNGISVKVRELNSTINSRAYKYLSILQQYDCHLPFNVISDYVLYDIVYRDRTCPDFDVDINPIVDYTKFLNSEYHYCSYQTDDNAIFDLIFNKVNYPLYKYHSYFINNVKNFEKIDEILDYHLSLQSESKQKEYDERRAVKKAHSVAKFNNYVSSL